MSIIELFSCSRSKTNPQFLLNLLSKTHLCAWLIDSMVAGTPDPAIRNASTKKHFPLIHLARLKAGRVKTAADAEATVRQLHHASYHSVTRNYKLANPSREPSRISHRSWSSNWYPLSLLWRTDTQILVVFWLLIIFVHLLGFVDAQPS